MKKITFLSSLLILILTVNACNKKTNENISQRFAVYLESNSQAVLYGSADWLGMLKKAEYKNIPKVGKIAEAYLKDLGESVELEDGVYFTMNGPFSEDGSPESTVLFLKVKSIDTLKAQALRQGYDWEEKGDLSYFRDHDFCLGTDGKLLIALVKGGDYEADKELSSIFNSSEGELKNQDWEQKIKQKGDIRLVADLEKAYGTSNTDLEKLPVDKKEQIKKLVKNSYIENVVYFEKGELRITSENHFSTELSKRKVFREDKNASIRDWMGGGNPNVALSLNLDLRQAQMWMEDVTGKSLEELVQNQDGPIQLAVMMAGGKLYNLLNGKIGMAIFFQGNLNLGITPDFKLYTGFGPNGKSLAQTLQSYMEDDSSLFMQMDEEGMQLANRKELFNDKGRMGVPNGCEDFGQKGITMFVDFEGMDMKSFELTGAAKMLELAKYMTLSYGEKGGEVILKLKNSDQNVLKQSADFLIEEFAGQIAGLTL